MSRQSDEQEWVSLQDSPSNFLFHFVLFYFWGLCVAFSQLFRDDLSNDQNMTDRRWDISRKNLIFRVWKYNIFLNFTAQNFWITSYLTQKTQCPEVLIKMFYEKLSDHIFHPCLPYFVATWTSLFLKICLDLDSSNLPFNSHVAPNSVSRK